MIFCICKEITILNNLFHEKIEFFKKIMMFILYDKQIFDGTLYYDNVDNYDIFKL
jgi:hypothetical protein